jgi:hypothetical protein
MSYVTFSRWTGLLDINLIPATLRVVAWVNHRLGGRLTSRGSSKLNPGCPYTPGPPEGTIEGATHIRTPSQAEHGLGGRFHFQCTISHRDLAT